MTNSKTSYPQDLDLLQKTAPGREEENYAFRDFLAGHDPRSIDEIVHRLNDEVSSSIDCTLCGNCCRSLMINIQPGEILPVAAVLEMPVDAFKETFVEESQQGKLVMNSIPCSFLHNNMCTVYESRYSSCREFPHLHKPGFNTRLFETFMHYNICPIVFHVVEQLKEVLSFNFSSNTGSEV
jgi:Fe-S-cluster containining protein